ncbi:MAG: hypothetical protein Q3971_01320 [Moraxella sp.]|nr:hypothetical protein [Moraxella sp.]
MKTKPIILYILNPIWVFFTIKEFLFEELSYFDLEIILMIIGIAGYSVFTYFYPNKYNKIVYYILFLVLNSIIVLTSPLGIAFALISGLLFTLKILLFFYLPPLLLIIFNMKQLMQMRTKKK